MRRSTCYARPMTTRRGCTRKLPATPISSAASRRATSTAPWRSPPWWSSGAFGRTDTARRRSKAAPVSPSGARPRRSSRSGRRHRCRISCAICLARSEEHTSELQSRPHLVCRLLLEKKKKKKKTNHDHKKKQKKSRKQNKKKKK